MEQLPTLSQLDEAPTDEGGRLSHYPERDPQARQRVQLLNVIGAIMESHPNPQLHKEWRSRLLTTSTLRLKGLDLPPDKLCLLLASRTQGFFQQPGLSVGNLCLSGNFARFNHQAQNSGPFGLVAIDVDMTDIRTSPPQPILAGQSWNFQLWHRDAGGTSNFTQGVEVLFE